MAVRTMKLLSTTEDAKVYPGNNDIGELLFESEPDTAEELEINMGTAKDRGLTCSKNYFTVLDQVRGLDQEELCLTSHALRLPLGITADYAIIVTNPIHIGRIQKIPILHHGVVFLRTVNEDHLTIDENTILITLKKK